MFSFFHNGLDLLNCSFGLFLHHSFGLLNHDFSLFSHNSDLVRRSLGLCSHSFFKTSCDHQALVLQFLNQCLKIIKIIRENFFAPPLLEQSLHVLLLQYQILSHETLQISILLQSICGIFNKDGSYRTCKKYVDDFLKFYFNIYNDN